MEDPRIIKVGDVCLFCDGKDIAYDGKDVLSELRGKLTKEELIQRSREKGLTCSMCDKGVATEETVTIWNGIERYKKRVNSKIKQDSGFEGFDWAELEEALGVDHNAEVRPLSFIERYEDQWLPLRRKLEEMRSKNMDEPNDPKLLEELELCRGYIRAYISYWERIWDEEVEGEPCESIPETHIYEGLLKTTNVDCFLSYLILLFPYMWH